MRQMIFIILVGLFSPSLFASNSLTEAQRNRFSHILSTSVGSIKSLSVKNLSEAYLKPKRTERSPRHAAHSLQEMILIPFDKLDKFQ